MVLWKMAMFCTVAAGGMRESFASALLLQGRVKADSKQAWRWALLSHGTFPMGNDSGLFSWNFIIGL